MVLVHETVKTARAPLDECLECALRADKLLGTSKYTAKIERISDNVYSVTFVWRKLGITRKFTVIFRVKHDDNKVIYESVQGSRYPMKMIFTFTRKNQDLVEVRVRAEMRAGLMADLLGRKDYAGFIEDLVETGILGMLKARAEKSRKKMRRAEAHCDKCILYDPVRNYCYYLRKPVLNTRKPPCGGDAYLPLT